nr:16S rRNA (cytosine(967)-C(5))-methyltransferase RsmB [Xanthomonas massiliensis]
MMAPTSPLAPGVAVRVAAAHVLGAVVGKGRSLKAELAAALPRLDDPRDRALAEAICLAGVRRHAAYAAALRQWLSRPPGRGDADLLGLLLAGFAQLDGLGLAPHAALSATVEAARALGRTRQAGLVNAVLRRLQREGLPGLPPEAGWPAWLVREIGQAWPAQAGDVFRASALPAPMWLRVNRRLATPADYVQALAQAGVAGRCVDGFADAVLLDVPVAVAALPGFAEGRVSVQDGSAQQVADALAPGRGARVLDACAAPGGKAAHLLERDPSLRLTALDVDARRLQRVAETLSRTGTAAERLVAADAGTPRAWWDGVPFDAVLLDAPCSATGVVRRQPDVLLHRRASDLDALTALQARLLDAAWQVLRPGGVLLYSTCSLLPRENAGQVQAFLARTPDAEPEPLAPAFGHASGAGRQRLTGEQAADGFFYARLRRRD